MDVSEATHDDRDVVRDIARRSLEASYPLAPRTIESAVRTWYDEGFEERLADPDAVILVGEAERGAVGVSESTLLGDVGEIAWLHVDPGHRGEGFGAALFERTREALAERGAEHLRGRVLASNAGGNAFYASRGLEKVAEDAVEIDGERHVEHVYADDPDAVAAAPTEERWVAGSEFHVDRGDALDGSRGDFHVAYADPDDETPYGYYCTNCEAVATAMDSMGRVQCGACGNVSTPTRWDAAYL